MSSSPRWSAAGCSRRKRAPRRIILLFVIVILVSGLITALVKRAVPSRSHQEESPRFNYTLALHKSLTFFNAQQSGKLPRTADYNTSWRGDSCLEEGNYTGSTYRDLVGGYYDGGDAVKSSFSMSYSMTLLSWSVIEYGAKYETAGELRHVKEIVKWGTDYFLKTFYINANTTTQMVLKVHSPNDDYCWMRPEDIDYKRHISLCFDECAQVAAEMTASLAAASIVFKEEMEYSQKLVYGAKALYSFALSVADTQTSKLDELLWGGTWLYFATGDLTYLDHTTSHVFADRAPSSYVFSWENKLLGTQLLLTRLRLFLDPGYPYEDGLRQCHIQTSRDMCSYLPDFKTFNRTKGGLIQFGDPKPLQYAANAAFLATLYSQYLEEAGIPGWECGTTFYPNQFLRDFSKSQIDYILGENPQNMSYVVGFGERYPTHVHHRGASIPPNQKQHSCTGGWKWRDSEEGNPNTIEGAMVAGPDKHDGFQDVRVKSNYTEPSLAGNAGLVAALVAVSGGEPVDKNTMFYALPPLYPVSPPPPAPWTP